MWLFLIPAFLCLGSLLTLVAYRLVTDDIPWMSPPICPKCHTPLAPYELIPLASWLFLRGTCSHCKKPISTLYPALELLTLLTMSGLIIFVPAQYQCAYFIFFCALLISVFTDCATLLISYFTTLFLIPLGFIFSYAGYLPLSLGQSVIGAASGFFILWATALIFFALTNRVGMGGGDFDILAFIGAFTGAVGWWFALLVGSLLGSLFGLYLMFTTKKQVIALPFGPFLAVGAITYVFWGDYFLSLLLTS